MRTASKPAALPRRAAWPKASMIPSISSMVRECVSKPVRMSRLPVGATTRISSGYSTGGRCATERAMTAPWCVIWNVTLVPWAWVASVNLRASAMWSSSTMQETGAEDEPRGVRPAEGRDRELDHPDAALRPRLVEGEVTVRQVAAGLGREEGPVAEGREDYPVLDLHRPDPAGLEQLGERLHGPPSQPGDGSGRRGYIMKRPPSTLNVWPTMSAARSDARKATMFAMSWGLVVRPSGIVLRTASRPAGARRA